MTLNEMIYHRKSCRSFLGQPVDSETIEKILSFEMKPLYPQIKVRMDIVSREKVKCICPWTTGAIPLDDPSQTDNERCINCMRCVASCPMNSRALPDAFRAMITKMLNEHAAGYKEPVVFL